jgi:uncharacterized membrane protein
MRRLLLNEHPAAGVHTQALPLTECGTWAGLLQMPPAEELKMNIFQSPKTTQGPSFHHHQAGAFPLLALLVATAAGVGLVVSRICLSGQWLYLSLVWNLFLAWLPLVFALGVCRQHRPAGRAGWKLWALAGLWLLFFPNAPYIFTDLSHLDFWFQRHYWADLSITLLIALTGFLVGFVSLYLMQAVVADRLGRAASWLFILASAGLGGLGIWIGRFLRWNSWDVFIHPVGLSADLVRLATHPLANMRSFAFQALFAALLFFGYLMLYALTHLRPAQRPVVEASA